MLRGDREEKRLSSWLGWAWKVQSIKRRMKYHTGLACIFSSQRGRWRAPGTVFGQLAKRGQTGEGKQHANVLTASTANKRNAKESAKESCGDGDGEIFVVEQISGLRWNCCQIGYKQFLLGSPVYGVVFLAVISLSLSHSCCCCCAVFWPAFFTYFSCLVLFFSVLASKWNGNMFCGPTAHCERRLKLVAKGQLR